MRSGTTGALLVALGLFAWGGGDAGAPAARSRHVVFLRAPAAQPGALARLAGDRAAVQRRMMADAGRVQSRFLTTQAPGLMTRRVEANWLANALVLELTADEAATLGSHPDVRRVLPDARIDLDDPEAEAPGSLAEGDDSEATWGLHAIGVLPARARHQVDGSGVLVGIRDTGYEETHPALAGKLESFRDFIDGRVEAYDDNGHGTHCAGTIGGAPHESGMQIGVAPAVRFVAGKIFNRSGFTQVSVILAGMQWVADPDGTPGTGDEPRLVSNSWGGPPGRDIFHEAVLGWERLGVLPVFAAGNAGPRPGSVGVPGGYPEAFAVGATTVETQVAPFSSRGPSRWKGQELIKPDVAAPGHLVTSAFPGGGYRALSGTSMATPHVAGVVALLLQKKPTLDASDLRYVLEETAVQHGPGEKNMDWGSGLIDVGAALDLVADPASGL